MTVTLTKTLWVITHNLSGYLPESDLIVVGTRVEACRVIADEMTSYADEDDEATESELIALGLTDEEPPVMLATVQAILKDDGPDATGMGVGAWGAHVEDGRGRLIYFEMSPVPAEDVDVYLTRGW